MARRWRQRKEGNTRTLRTVTVGPLSQSSLVGLMLRDYDNGGSGIMPKLSCLMTFLVVIYVLCFCRGKIGGVTRVTNLVIINLFTISQQEAMQEIE